MKKISLMTLFGVILMTQLHAAQPAASVRLKTNQQMVDITLAANATTGFQWFVQNYDHDLLSLQNYRYVANTKKPGVVGSGGVAVFTFAVDPRFYDAPQTTYVTFVYQQPWNPGKGASTAQVAVSAVASSNDYSDWQKYPQLAGPAASVQAGEADIYAEDQPPAAIPAPMVAIPGSNPAAQTTPPAAMNTTVASPMTVSAPNADATNNQPVTTMDAPVSTPDNNPPVINNQVDNMPTMPTGEPTPNTNSQSQWLSLPQNSTTSAPANNPNSAALPTSATPKTQTTSTSSASS